MQRQRLVHLRLSDDLLHLVALRHAAIADGDEHVARPDAGLLGRSARHDFDDPHLSGIRLLNDDAQRRTFAEHAGVEVRTHVRGEHGLQLHHPAIAEDDEIQRSLRAALDDLHEVAVREEFATVNRHDLVAGAQPGEIGGRVRRDFADDDAARGMRHDHHAELRAILLPLLVVLPGLLSLLRLTLPSLLLLVLPALPSLLILAALLPVVSALLPTLLTLLSWLVLLPSLLVLLPGLPV